MLSLRLAALPAQAMQSVIAVSPVLLVRPGAARSPRENAHLESERYSNPTLSPSVRRPVLALPTLRPMILPNQI